MWNAAEVEPLISNFFCLNKVQENSQEVYIHSEGRFIVAFSFKDFNWKNQWLLQQHFNHVGLPQYQTLCNGSADLQEYSVPTDSIFKAMV